MGAVRTNPCFAYHSGNRVARVPGPMNWLQSLLSAIRALFGGGGVRSKATAVDSELAEVFMAELGELGPALAAAFAKWRENPNDKEALRRLQRGFHTIKGSAPLVGAKSLANLCAHAERATARLVDAPSKATPEATRALEQAVGVLPAFEQALRESRPPPSLRALTDRMRRVLA